MKLRRRQFLQLATSAATLPIISIIARAQTYPTKPVRIIVNLAAGGGTDFLARLIGEYVSRGIGQQVVIENKVGAGGLVGAEAVPTARQMATRCLLLTMWWRARRQSCLSTWII
jgi:tripartite-type tricarboxylate transporter receptor subunit TctC